MVSELLGSRCWHDFCDLCLSIEYLLNCYAPGADDGAYYPSIPPYVVKAHLYYTCEPAQTIMPRGFVGMETGCSNVKIKFKVRVPRDYLSSSQKQTDCRKKYRKKRVLG